jgi:hypothetical protein
VVAQRLTLGAVVGTSVTGDFHPGSYNSGSGTAIGGPYDGQAVYSTITTSPTSRQFIVGPKLELRLPWRLSVEADALHRTVHQKMTYIVNYSGGTTTVYDYPESTNATWEIPVLAKYRFSRSNWSRFSKPAPPTARREQARTSATLESLSAAASKFGRGVSTYHLRFDTPTGSHPVGSANPSLTRWKSSLASTKPAVPRLGRAHSASDFPVGS